MIIGCTVFSNSPFNYLIEFNVNLCFGWVILFALN